MDVGLGKSVSWLRRLVGVTLLVAGLAAVGVDGQVTECQDCCFDDVIVIGAGAWWANTRYVYTGWLRNGRPTFVRLDNPACGEIWYDTSPSAGWYLYSELCPATGPCTVTYYSTSAALTPPGGVWVVFFIASGGCGSTSGMPSPQLSGGGACGSPGELVPAGLVKFLDRGWPEGEEPPVVGELAVSATYGAGDLITGCCSVEDPMGNPVEVPYVILTWYAATIGDDFDVREPLEARLLQEQEGIFCFVLETEGLTPGYYDIRLGVPFQDDQWLRVEVVAPAE